jgi:hypothetical protein
MNRRVHKRTKERENKGKTLKLHHQKQSILRNLQLSLVPKGGKRKGEGGEGRKKGKFPDR